MRPDLTTRESEAEEMGNAPAKWYTADTHFGHARVIELSRRPFSDAAAMDEAMIARWNARVPPDGVVHHVGDFATYGRGAEKIRETFGRLNGEKHLIIGNHDEDNADTLALPWASVSRQAEIMDGAHRVLLCHYPMVTWPGARKAAVHLYGHTHGDLPGTRTSLDVGVDAHGFAPVTLDEALRKMRRMPDWHARPARWRG